ncbi:MAG: hypothetical protein HQK97_12185, partial [Nitrospirae bacterium]|nr:hypothetical protein [Nitrospirota bacterium]
RGLAKKFNIEPPPTLMPQLLMPPFGPINVSFDAPKTSDNTTEGEFAAALAGQLALGKQLPPKDAVEKLTKIGIAPGIAPNGGWDINRKTSDVFIYYVQKALYDIIKSALLELKQPVPATFVINAKFAS